MVQQLVNVLALTDEADFKTKSGAYPEVHRTPSAKEQDNKISWVLKWFENRTFRPGGLKEKEYTQFVRFTNWFIMYEGRLYHRGQDAKHRLYVEKKRRMYMLTAAHDHVGHRGFYATNQLLIQRFWWPEMEKDVNWFIKTCHVCQERQKTMLKIKPVITHTPSIFQTLHADVMHMTPASNGCPYIAHGRCAMTSWMEGRALRKLYFTLPHLFRPEWPDSGGIRWNPVEFEQISLKKQEIPVDSGGMVDRNPPESTGMDQNRLKSHFYK
ncbi:hypothetical protein GALMADRAFT_82499 [Galerina marginata CBS 339.88]|uniref:Integrase zinc-binding domain-containing protein n=1 Tax=Galerina marginata (strain CBS 339.88) TaxID=685588 RepID=A0A067S2F9_GALM3|nr:hypothetical protein GALMADRAFT_82499 [Galerina marginata CBS 339.88]